MSSVSLAKQLIGKRVFIKNKRKPLTSVVDVIYNKVISRAVCLVVDKCAEWREPKIIPLHAVKDIKTKSIIIGSKGDVIEPSRFSHNVAKLLNQEVELYGFQKAAMV